jgi:signal transduction histidine kinase
MRRHCYPTWVRYGVALASSTAVVITRRLVMASSLHAGLSAGILYPAIFVSGWFGGAATGLLSTAIGTMALLLDRPLSPLPPAAVETVTFVLNGVLVSAVCERLRQTRDRFAAEARRKEELQTQNALLYEDARQANEAKDEFLAVLSHELRTPLNAIVGWTDMLRGGRLPLEQCGRALEIIDRNARVAGQLLADMLDISRIVAGKLNVERRPVDLREIVTAAADTLRWAVEDKGLLVNGLSAGPPLMVNGDGERLQQVVCNLLGNAVKFTPPGGRVDVRLTRRDDSVELAVEDDGIGIRPGLLPHVFERFRQGDTGTTREYRGLGLGLAIARHVIELHEGAIEAHSDGPDRGSRFTIRLPLLSPGELAAPTAPALAAVTGAPGPSFDHALSSR